MKLITLPFDSRTATFNPRCKEGGRLASSTTKQRDLQRGIKKTFLEYNVSSAQNWEQDQRLDKFSCGPSKQ